MDYAIVLTLFFFGIIGGFISGLLGVGGGIIFVPVLSTLLASIGYGDQELAKYILANSFASTFFAGAISTYKQYKLNSFHPQKILLTASLAIPISLLITHLIATGNWYSKEKFSYFFIVLLVFMLYRILAPSKRVFKPNSKELRPWHFPVTGALTGVISGLSGLGGGIIMVPLFTQYLKLDIKKAAAISIGVIPIMMIPMLILYGSYTPTQEIIVWHWGYLLPSIFLPLVAGLLFAAPMGVAIGQKASSQYLKLIFAVLVFTVIIKTIGTIIYT
ncbi:MAG: putative membrane protein YfcA [Bacteroidia bacterium]|jgi:uncharacterized membrane protein YfcA